MLNNVIYTLKNMNDNNANVSTINHTLALIKKITEDIISEPINVAQIFGCQFLDDACQKIGATNLKKIKINIKNRDACKQQNIIYVVSRLYMSGGHTAALTDIIRLSPSANKHIILVTGIGGPTNNKVIQHRFGLIANVTFEFAPSGNYGSKLDWLQNRLLTLQPTDVWLFNHHQDSVAVAAVQPNEGYRLHFYHHADHHLCLGVYLNYANHIDINSSGFHNCRTELNINNSYLPLVVADQGNRTNLHFCRAQNGLVTATAAGHNKVEVIYPISYIDVVPHLLKATGGKHIHMGPLSFWARYKIRRGIRKLGLPASTFVYLPFVSSVWKVLHEYNVDLYVTSFPYGGARTLIEVMGSGTPVVAHNHYTSRLLATFDLIYDGAFMWRDPQELYDIVLNVNEIDLAKHSQLARRRYEQFHSENILQQALQCKINLLEPPALKEGYCSDVLQRAIEVCQQVSPLSVLKRMFVFIIRKLKSTINFFDPS